jgi:hypothetical protein
MLGESIPRGAGAALLPEFRQPLPGHPVDPGPGIAGDKGFESTDGIVLAALPLELRGV